MRSCTRPRERFEACREAGKGRETPQPEFRRRRRVRKRPFEARKNRHKVRGRPLRPRSRPLKVRGRPLKDRGKPQETKSLQEHLIKSLTEREKRRAAKSRQAAECE